MPRPINYQRNRDGLNVPLDGHIVDGKADVRATVKVYKYQNVNSKYRIEAAVKPKQALLSCCLTDKSPPAKIGGLTVPPWSGMDKLIGRVHIGCGSYNDIRSVIQLVAYYSSQNKFPYMKGMNASNYDRKLQEYCDNYIGIDCVGFVAGFAKDVVGLTGLRGVSLDESYSLSTGSFIYSLTHCRKSLSAVLPEDVMVWESVSHIALIDSLTVLNATEAKVTFAESLGQWGWKEAGEHLGVHAGEGVLKKAAGGHQFNLKRLSTGKLDGGLSGVEQAVKVIDLI